MHCFDVVTNHCLELKGGSEEYHHTLLPSSCPSLYKIQSFIYIICLCHYVVIYEGSLSCDYQLLRKRGSGDVFQLLLMDPRNFPRWQKRSGWWGKGMKRQIVVTDWVSLSRFWYRSSTPTSQELSSPIFQSESVCLLWISNTWPDLNLFFQYIKAYMPFTDQISLRINQ